MPLSACSAPANKDERKQVGPLLEMIAVKTGKPGRSPRKPQRLAADKGYDSDPLRDFLKSKGIRPQIPRKKNASKRRGRPVSMSAPRFQVERTFSWLQRKFRRLVVRWERLPRCFDAFLTLAVCFMWTQRVKGKTSHKLLSEYPHLRKTCWGRHFWAQGYFCCSSGNVTDEVIKQYIEGQDCVADDNFKVDGES